jgi:hypothetical protein
MLLRSTMLPAGSGDQRERNSGWVAGIKAEEEQGGQAGSAVGGTRATGVPKGAGSQGGGHGTGRGMADSSARHARRAVHVRQAREAYWLTT